MDDKTFALFDFIINSLLIITFITSIVSFVLNLIFNKCDKCFKINSVVSHLLITAFIPLYYIIFNYLIDTYLLYFSSTYTYSIINILLIAFSLIIISLNYIFKNKTKLIRGIELGSLLVSVITIVTMFLMQYSDKVFVVLNFLTVIFMEYFIVNSSENLSDKVSKIIFLTTNIIISSIFIISLILLVLKLSFYFDLTLALIGLFVLIISLIPLLTAYIKLKKEHKND